MLVSAAARATLSVIQTAKNVGPPLLAANLLSGRLLSRVQESPLGSGLAGRTAGPTSLPMLQEHGITLQQHWITAYSRAQPSTEALLQKSDRASGPRSPLAPPRAPAPASRATLHRAAQPT